MSKESSDYEPEYRSTIQPRTAVRSQSRQSGGSFSIGGGGGGKLFCLKINIKWFNFLTLRKIV